MRSFLAVFVRGLAIALVAAAAVAAIASSPSQLKGWRDGPASCLLTEEEYKRFGELRTDPERQTYIDRFWHELEADSGAPPESYRETFEQRCAAANLRFGTGGRDGWRTDRGRVFLALGEPSTIRHEPGDVTALQKEVWSYDRSAGMESPLQIVFYRCHDGGYRLDSSCSIERDPTSVAYDGERADFLRKLRVDNAATGRLLAMLNGILLPVPGGVPLSRAPAERAVAPLASPGASPTAAGAPPGVHALASETYFFRAQDRTVLTLLSVQLLASRNGGGPAPRVSEPAYIGVASIEKTGRRGEDLPETSPRPVELGPAPGGGQEGGAAFFGRVYLEAGQTYAVRYAVKDGARDEIFVKNALVGVPDLGTGFSASSIVPAEEFGPAAPGTDRFRIGSEKVIPKTGGVFRRSELLRLYLQVYDAAVDLESSMPRVDVEFRFYRLIKGASKRYGKPFSVRGATGASMGLALPIGDWPPGPYRVAVELHDRVAEARTWAEGWFSIAAE